jgi:hypothetical protein
VFPKLKSLRIAAVYAKGLHDIEAVTALTRLRELDLSECSYIIPKESLAGIGQLLRHAGRVPGFIGGSFAHCLCKAPHTAQ